MPLTESLIIQTYPLILFVLPYSHILQTILLVGRLNTATIWEDIQC